ncbi:MAG: hypothetical protein HRT82_16305 [Henriciella sp.]|nr:hypothetical protein [Henriciella sp.]
MTAIPANLPVRRVLINLSQSNGAPVADAKSYEDANPQIAVRHPVYGRGAFLTGDAQLSDQIVLPDGDFGDFQTINYRNTAWMNVRYLTFFDPRSTALDRTLAAPSDSTTYPGVVEVTSVVNSRTFITGNRWHIDPSGSLTLTRLRNGAQHTIAARPAVNSLTVGESFDPPLEARERFSYTLTAGQDSSDNVSLTFYNQFGGLHDIGGNFEVALAGVAGTYPSAVVDGSPNSVWEVTFADNGSLPGSCFCREHAAYVGRKVQFVARSGTLPAPLGVGTDYYITRVGQGSDANPNGYVEFFVSATPGGTEIAFASGAVGDFVVSFMPDGRDSTLVGLNVRCLTGANAGEVRPLGGITESGGVWTCAVTSPFSSPCLQGDTFAIEPPAVDGSPVPLDQWAYFLPMCPFNGREKGLVGQLPVTLSAIDTFEARDPAFGLVAPPLYNGTPVRLFRRVFSDGSGTSAGTSWHPELTEGRIYYVVNATDTTFQLSDTYDGAPLEVRAAVGETHWMDLADSWLTKSNPAPPGFNYFNARSAPIEFQPYGGSGILIAPDFPRMSYHMSLAQRLSEHYGEDIYVIDLAVGGTTLSQQLPVDMPPLSRSWYDASTMTNWAAGPGTLRARAEEVFTAAQTAAAREGVRLEVLGVVFPQGESDTVSQDRADRYFNNLQGFKAWVRRQIKSRGWWPKDEVSIPFLQPKVRTNTAWQFADTVNKAIQDSAEADPYGLTWSTESYTLIDAVHYDGKSADQLAKTAASNLTKLLSTDDTVLRICQLALSEAGEKAAITSVYPPDGSEEAALCARFYPEARDQMLEMHNWDFLMRTAQLVKTDNEREDWKYAYELPLNFNGVVMIGDDIMSSYDNRAQKIKHTIELNSDSQRVLYCNQDTPLQVRYKAKTVNPGMFSTKFVSACASLMASMIVRATLKGTEGIQAGAALEARAKDMFKEAAAVDANLTRDRSQSGSLGWRR